MNKELNLALLVASITAITTWGGIWLTSFLEGKQTKEKSKQLLIGELEGIRIWRQQLYQTRLESEIFSDYHEYKHKITKNDIDLSEAMRWMSESERLTLEVAKINQQFLEKLALVEILFKKSDNLKELIETNRNFLSPRLLKRADSDMSLEELEELKNRQKADIISFTKEEAEKIKNLVEKLRSSI